MKQLFFYSLIFSSLFQNLSSEPSLKGFKEVCRAERMIENGDLEEGLQHYRELLNQAMECDNDFDENFIANLRYRTANTAYLAGNDQEVIRVLNIDYDQVSAQGHYLVGLSYRNLGKYQEAISALLLSLGKDYSNIKAHGVLAALYILQKDYSSAKIHIEQLIGSSYQHYASILNIYIDIVNRDYQQAYEKLNTLPVDNPLVNMMQGYTCMCIGEHLKAIHFFESALPHCNVEKQHYLLGCIAWCCFKAGDLLSAEDIFSSLTSKKRDITLRLMYAQVLLAQPTPSKRELVANLLREDYSHHPYALFLYSQAIESPRERKSLHQKCLHDRNFKTRSFGEKCFLVGLTEMIQGEQLIQHAQAEGHEILCNASTLFRQAQETCRPEQAFEAALFEAQALLSTRNSANMEAALEKFKEMCRKFPEHPDLPKVKFLIGLAHYSLHQTHAAEEAWKDAGTSSPYALFALASLHQQQGLRETAESQYLELAQAFPNLELSGDAYYFASLDSNNAPYYREKVYTDYPQSKYAAEACFHQYSQSEYLGENEAAGQHLELFLKKFPRSPLVIHGYYMLGLRLAKDEPVKAIEAFQMAEMAFAKLTASNLISEEQLDYYIAIRYRSGIEKALGNMAIAEQSVGAKKQIYFEYAIEQFKELTAAIPLKEDPKLQSLYDEALFGLAQAYIKANHDISALEVLNDLQKRYEEKHTTRGYFLSRTLFEKGMIAKRQDKYREALTMLNSANEAGKGNILSGDQKVDLQIQLSQCYEHLGDHDKAMLCLSTAINEDVISSLRLKAMYLRAELYISQGRHELAKRQLEALSLKSGEWGRKGQELLHDLQQTQLDYTRG